MTKIKFNGKEYDCLEHVKEIKEFSDLFNKYYNKKQLFKDLLYKVTRDYRPIGDRLVKYEIPNGEDGEFGRFIGQKVYSGSECFAIEIYRIEDLDPETFEEIDFVLDDGDSFLVKDDDGQVYFFYIEMD